MEMQCAETRANVWNSIFRLSSVNVKLLRSPYWINYRVEIVSALHERSTYTSTCAKACTGRRTALLTENVNFIPFRAIRQYSVSLRSSIPKYVQKANVLSEETQLSSNRNQIRSNIFRLSNKLISYYRFQFIFCCLLLSFLRFFPFCLLVR